MFRFETNGFVNDEQISVLCTAQISVHSKSEIHIEVQDDVYALSDGQNDTQVNDDGHIGVKEYGYIEDNNSYEDDCENYIVQSGDSNWVYNESIVTSTEDYGADNEENKLSITRQD